MPTGFDNRQAGRSTFAFTSGQPAQTRNTLDGNSRGASIQGGNSSGEAVFAGPQTSAGSLADSEIPQFLASAMEPYVKKAQGRQFAAGMVAAAKGTALKELTKSSRGVMGIFGPNFYEQGAQKYTADASVSRFFNEQAGDTDKLVRMKPETVAGHLFDNAQKFMTGDPFADQQIQQQVIEQSVPFLNNLAKKRLVWQQEEIKKAQSQSFGESALSYQTSRRDDAALSAPTDGDTAARIAADNAFLSSRQKPIGQTEESYQEALYADGMNLMAQGNWYGFNALKDKGLYARGGPLTDEQLTKIEGAYDRYANKSNEAIMPQLLPDLIAWDLKQKSEMGEQDPAVRVVELAKMAVGINAKAAKLTGMAEPLLDAADIRSGAGNLTNTLLAAYHRKEARAQAVADHARDRGEKLADEERARNQVAAEARAAWVSGDAASAILGGMKSGDIEILANNDWAAGNTGSIVRQFQTKGYTAPAVQQAAQAPIKASLGVGYTEAFGKAHEDWGKLTAASSGAARAYYGEQFVPMQKFDMLVRSGIKPELAHAKSFGDPAIYGAAEIPIGIRKEVDKALPAAIQNSEAWSVFGFGYLNPNARTRLNQSSVLTMQSALRAQVGREANGNTDQPIQALVNGAMEHMLASGLAERAGAFAWLNPANNKPMTEIVGASGNEFDAAFTNVLGRRLEADGFAAGADADNYTILRTRDVNGKASMYVLATDENGGNAHDVLITSDEIKAEFEQGRSKEVRANNQPGWHASTTKQDSGAGVYRRIKGETAWDRQKRIQRETKAGYDSAPPRPLPSIPGANIPGQLLDANKRLIREQRERYRPNDK